MTERHVTQRPPQRLSPLTPVVRSFIVLVAAAWTVFRDITQGQIGPTAILFGLLLLGGAVFGTASWLRTTFWIEADELRVDTGVLSRQSRRIRIDRLQGIDIVQPFVARIFGLAELRMDVAGGDSREGSLAYLPLVEARRLKDLLLTRRDELGGRENSHAPAAPVPAEGVVLPASGAPAPTGQAPRAPAGVAGGPMAMAERRIAAVDLGMLLLSIVVSGETVALVVLSLGLATGFVLTGQLAGLSAMLPILLGFGFAMFRKLAANYRFTVSETPAGLQLRRGLFELSAQTIALHRVQGVVVSEPVLWRGFGWVRLDVSIAGYGGGVDNDRPAPSTVLPVADPVLAHQVARHVLRGLDPDAVALRPVPRRARWVAPLTYRFLSVGADEQLMVAREGWLVRRTHAAPQARIQSVRITQGPWQRLLGLADVHADSPPGPTDVRARHRDAAEARRLFDAEVEATGRARHSQR